MLLAKWVQSNSQFSTNTATECSIGSDSGSGGQLRLVRKRDLDAERYQTHSVREAKRNRTGQRLPEVARFELETGWQWQGTRMNATTGKEGSARCDEFTRKLR